MALLLELVQEIAEAAAEHAARCAACEQAAQSALEDIAETAGATTTGKAGSHITGQFGRLPRCRASLAGCEMLDGFPGQQAQDCHGHGRHPASAFGWCVWRARATRAVLHAVEYVE